MPTTNVAQFAPTTSPNAPYLVPVEAGTFTPPGGAALPYSRTTLPAFYDAWLAQAWVDELARRLADAARLSALYVPIDTISDASGAAQVEYVYGLFSCIANYYNSLDIVWSSHPQARALYRRWFAGAPKGTGQATVEAAQFAGDVNYKDGWYIATYPWPQTPPPAELARFEASGNTPMGILPMQARTLFARYGGANANNPSQFVPGAGLYLDVEDYAVGNPRDLDPSVNTSTTVRNRAFAWNISGNIGLSPGALTLRVDSDREDPGLPSESAGVGEGARWLGSNAVVAQRFLRGVMFGGGIGFGDLPRPPGGARFDAATGARIAGGDNTDWRLFQMDETAIPAPLKIYAPLDAYVGYAREWLGILQAQRPVEVLISSRLYTIYANATTIRLNGSIQTLINTDAEIASDVRTPDPVANAVFTAVGAVGGVVSVAGPIGAAVGLALTAASAVGRIVNAAVDHAVGPSHHRDDLGQWKPYWLRLALSGSVRTGFEAAPTIQVPAPEGWRRPVLLSIGGLPASSGSPPVADGEELLKTMHLTPKQWLDLDAAGQDAALGRIGLNDDAARAAGRAAIQYFIDPASRPHPRALQRGLSTNTALLLAGGAVLVYLMSRRR